MTQDYERVCHRDDTATTCVAPATGLSYATHVGYIVGKYCEASVLRKQ